MVDNSVLVIDDDEPFRASLSKALQRRGFPVRAAGSIADALVLASAEAPDHAVVDLRLGDGNGLELTRLLRQVAPVTRIVMLTGYGNIASAVSAIKAGAVDYLPKPVDIDHLVAILRGGDASAAAEEVVAEPMTPERVRWEHIQRVFVECHQNVSETARRLRMHRRTLQRILNKHAPS